nr:MSCRAMM family adhesin SdrC [Gammaproteobacteria bacterium]
MNLRAVSEHFCACLADGFSLFNPRIAVLLSLVMWSPSTLAQSLSLGPFGEGVTTGSEPFALPASCNNSGEDCGANDARIRTADLQNHFWSISMSNIPVGDPPVASVILEQTLIPGADANVQFDEMPTICLAPPQGPGGTNPTSSVINNGDGSITLLCNLGAMANGDQKSFSVPIRPMADSADGATFTSHQKVYGLDALGAKIVSDVIYHDPQTYVISSAPAWDLIGDRRSIYRGGVTTKDVGTGRGPELGYYLWTTVHLSADVDRAGKGVSALTDSFSFNNLLTAVESDGVTPFPFEYSIVQCIPNPSGWGNTVWGNESIRPNDPLGEHVVDSGSCAISGDTTNGWTLTANNVDTRGTRYPTQTINNSSLAAGPYFAMAYRVQIFVPFSEIDRENPTPSSGSLNLTNCFNDFDPVDNYSVSNYGGGLEPGYNGTAMPDGSASNNCSGPLTIEIRATGGFNHRTLSRTNDGGSVIYAPYLSSYHTGEGLVEPTVSWPYMSYVVNQGSVSLSNTQLCTAFDNSTQRLSDRASVGGSAGKDAFVVAGGGGNTSDWQIEYASINYAAVDPLDSNNDGAVDFNPMSGRYEGDWNEMRTFRCDDPAVSWNTDLNVIGRDNVNAVRVVKASPTVQLHAGHNLRLMTPVQARDVFYGGPYDGTPIPVGTVMPSFGNWRSDEFRPGGFTNNYMPSPESTSSHGDRMSLTRVTVDVAKSTVTPFAAAGTTTSTLAGNPVVWQLEPVVSSVLSQGSTAINAEVVDVLPEELTYDQACTLAEPGAVAPTQILYNTPSAGQTTLKWPLGNLDSTQVHAPIIYCTITDATAPAGTAAVNSAYMSADNAVVSTPTQQTVTLGQAGSIQSAASVDVPVDRAGDSQHHTLTWSNFSEASTVANPVVINVLPYNGDSAGLAARSPASNFTGSLTLSGPATETWMDGSVPTGSDPFSQIGLISYSADVPTTINHDPDSNASDWCHWDGLVFIPDESGMSCPADFSSVTAIKHVSNYELEVNGNPRQGIKLSYTLQASGNRSGDRYVNLFGTDSIDLPATQYIKSNRSIIVIAGHSIGDLIFIDINSNGAFDDGIDLLAPDGLAVELRDYDTGDLVESTQTVDGTYLFDELEPGDYFVQIPATWFAPGNPLMGWTVAVGAANANTDVNHDVDHNGMVTGSVLANGILTDKITVDAEIPLPGAAPTGNEPIGDNIIPIVDANTNDDFSNLTIDIGIISADTDQDGIPDAYEFGPGGVSALADTDGDGIADYLDTDTDGDGVPDAIEFGGNLSGFHDSDGDGIPDLRDLDSDNDGIPDSVEAPNSGLDSDNDGIDDQYDVDATGGSDLDGNGIDDAVEAGGLLDTDGDGVADVHDLDSDNDGLTDTKEAGGLDSDGDGLIDGFTDGNGDGLADSAGNDPLPVADIDGDGAADYLDIDSDNDGINDTVEAGGLDADNDGEIDGFSDSDGDGLDDLTAATPLAVPNTDGNGAPNHADVD